MRKLSRLDLAKWLVSPRQPADGPRLRQSAVEAVLRHRACRKSLDDFGSQGDRRRIPNCSTGWRLSSSDSGWDVKHIVQARS